MGRPATGEHAAEIRPELQPGTASDARSRSASGLQGRWLLLARATWLFLFVAILVQFVISLPSYLPTVKRLQ